MTASARVIKDEWDLGLAPPIFLFVTSEAHHDDRNGRIISYIFHCHVMISSFAKVTGLQSRLILEKKCDSKCFDTKNIILGIEIIFSRTAVLILVIKSGIVTIESLQLKLLVIMLVFYTISTLWVNLKKTTF